MKKTAAALILLATLFSACTGKGPSAEINPEGESEMNTETIAETVSSPKKPSPSRLPKQILSKRFLQRTRTARPRKNPTAIMLTHIPKPPCSPSIQPT